VKFVINDNRKDSSESIIGGVSFHHKLMVQKPMVKDWGLGKGLLQSLKSRAAFVIEDPWSTLLGEPS